MRAKKSRLYQNGGRVGDPPQGTITPQGAMDRLQQLKNPDRLRSGNAPFRTINQEKDRMASEGTDEAMFELIRMFPVIGEAIDLVEAGKVNLTGKDLSGRETDKGLYNTFAVAGLVIPNVLEGPLKFLLRKGARNTKEAGRLLHENLDAADLAPLKELQKKAEQFESRLIRGARPTYEATKGIDELGEAASPALGAKNWMLENDPDLLMQFTPEAYDQGMFDRRMQEFGDQYLTMYRGVNAPDVETASRYMVEAPKGAGIGGQNAGPGIYGTSVPSIVKGGRGSGYTGTLRTAPDVAQSFDPSDRIISDLVRLERDGMMSLPMAERRALSDMGAFPGMSTVSDRVRVVRSLPASQQKILDISSPGKEFVPKYKSDFGGAGRMIIPYETQRGLETSIERLMPLIKGYKNGGKIVKYKI
jgi:HPt (histidine-containing phosphotransfer) domain-containing protein